MRKITYTNGRGESIVFYLSPLLITRLEGIAEVGMDIQTQRSPYQDGTTYIDNKLDARRPYLEGTITETYLESIQQYRNEITRICNPKLGMGELKLEQNGITRVIDAIPDGIPSFPDKRQNPHQKFIIDFYCPDPDWKSMIQETEPLSAFMGMWSFPMSFPVEFGQQGSSATIDNNGDMECPIEIQFTGYADRPVVTNATTGDYVRINRVIEDGETLLINSSYGDDRKIIIIKNDGTEENAYHYWESINDSPLPWLTIGENVLEYTADDEGENAGVLITYQKRYAAV